MSKKRKGEKPEDIETVPDSWERFERAVDAAIKSGPKHREAPSPKPKRQKRKTPTK